MRLEKLISIGIGKFKWKSCWLMNAIINSKVFDLDVNQFRPLRVGLLSSNP